MAKYNKNRNATVKDGTGDQETDKMSILKCSILINFCQVLGQNWLKTGYTSTGG